MPKEAKESSPLESMALGLATLPIGLRGFLSDISPGLLLLLIVYLFFQDALDLEGDAVSFKAVLFTLVAIPMGFIANSVGYFLFGMVVRMVEGAMMRSDFMCAAVVTAQDWASIKRYFGLGRIKKHVVREYLVFRYECERYIKEERAELYQPVAHLVGAEILCRTVALLALLTLVLLYVTRGELDYRLAAAVPVFLLLSALDSLYVGLKCIHSLYVICRYELDAEREPQAENDLSQVLAALYRQKLDREKRREAVQLLKLAKALDGASFENVRSAHR